MEIETTSEICEFQKLKERKGLILLEDVNRIHSELLQNKDFESAQLSYQIIKNLRSQFYPVA